jgi:hypothetical protein
MRKLTSKDPGDLKSLGSPFFLHYKDGDWSFEMKRHRSCATWGWDRTRSFGTIYPMRLLLIFDFEWPRCQSGT